MTDERTFAVLINTEHAAFEGDNLGDETARILREIADRVERGDMPRVYANVYDSNGNAAGRYRLRDEHYPD